MVLKNFDLNNIRTSYYDSTNVLKSIYDIQTNSLEVIFGKGQHYLYEGIIPYIYQRFQLSQSKGKAVQDYLVKHNKNIQKLENISNEELIEIKEFIINAKK